MRKLLAAVFVVVIALGFMVTSVSAAAPKVFLDGQQLTFDVDPTVENGRMLVPLRVIFEALGCDVYWDDASASVTAVSTRQGGTTIRLQLGSQLAKIRGREVTLDVPARAVSGRTLVPLRFVSEAMGCEVTWDEVTGDVTIVTGPKPDQGTYTYPAGATYTGDLVNGIPNGEGEIVWPDGGKYVGEFKDGILTGNGVFYDPNGNVTLGYENYR